MTSTKNKVKLIFDTDIGGDCDDAGALALIHRLCNKNEAELLAVTFCGNSIYAPGCIDAINTFFGRRVPIGVHRNLPPNEKSSVYDAPLCNQFPNSYPAALHNSPTGPEDTLKLWRKILAAAEDRSITLVVTGNLYSMARFIESKADEISPLSGRELLTQKVLRTVLMGGRFFESWPMAIYESGNPAHHLMTWEYNIKCCGHESAKTVFENWDGELILSSYEIGTFIVTLKDYAARSCENNPVAEAYRLFSGNSGRCSWDLTAVLAAVRPNVYWNLHEFGEIYIDNESVTHWRKNENKKHSYLLPKTDYATVQAVIDDLIDKK